MPDLICTIARCLAEFDQKVWGDLTVQQQEPYAARAIMTAHLAREHFKPVERSEPAMTFPAAAAMTMAVAVAKARVETST